MSESEWKSLFDAPIGEWVEAVWGRPDEGEGYEPEVDQVRLVRESSEFPFHWELRSGEECSTPWGWRPIVSAQEGDEVQVGTSWLPVSNIGGRPCVGFVIGDHTVEWVRAESLVKCGCAHRRPL